MSVLDQLKRQRGLYAVCPNCEESFPVADAGLFDATKPLPAAALEHLDGLRKELEEGRTDLVKRRLRAKEKPRLAAEAVNIGKVVEKIAPSLPGFPVDPGDCRSLLEPIDYVVFAGLAGKGRVEAMFFVEAKSGQARLNDSQREVKALVERGKVSLVIAEHGRVT
jgi:predicted Holliday junction resolvase-like endonuclease